MKKNIYFTPGPTYVCDDVKGWIQQALDEDITSISHRGPEFKRIAKSCKDGLKDLLGLDDSYHIFFISSGTEAMERIIENTVIDKSFHLVNGAFSKRFYEISLSLGKSAEILEAAEGKSFDDIPNIDSELICLTHNETSTGVKLTKELMAKIRSKNPDTLIAVDIVSSAPITDFDPNIFDMLFFSVQKCFSLPAGLAVLIVNDKAMDKARMKDKIQSIGSYHSFINLLKYEEKDMTPETPNVLLIYLLDRVTWLFNEIGREDLVRSVKDRANAIYQRFEGKCFVLDENNRSDTVIVVKRDEELFMKLVAMGLIVGEGYGANKDSQMRIANFPLIPKDKIKALLDS